MLYRVGMNHVFSELVFPARIMSSWIRLGRIAAAVFIAGVFFLPGTPSLGQISEFNQPGNYLIADQFNNRVIEVGPHGNIVWQFGRGPADFSSASIIGVNDAQRVGRLTLMSGTGTPGGQPEAPNCTNPNGCPDNRVLLVNHAGHMVWHMGSSAPAAAAPISSTLRYKTHGFQTGTF
jgi:hypothetical protein